MAGDPSNPFFQRETNPATATKPAASSPAPGTLTPETMALLATAKSAPQPAPQPVPTDAKAFQAYLNAHGANPPLVVDGQIGPKTLAAAQKLGIAVPQNLASPAPASPSQPAAPAPAPSAPNPTPGNVATPTPVASPQDVNAAIKAEFGSLGALLDIPDIAAVIDQATAQGIDPTSEAGKLQINALIKATPTYQTHQANELNFMALKPADQQALIEGQASTVKKTAGLLGITLSDQQVNDVAGNAARFSWSTDQVNAAIGAAFQYKPGGQSGSIGAAEQSVRAWAQDYGVSDLLDDTTLASYDSQIANGTANAQSFQQKIVTLAQQRFRGLAGEITATNPTSNALAPYKQIIQQELGKNPDEINWSDPQWMRLVDQVDPKTGAHVPMSIADATHTIRSDNATYGWDKTQKGIASYAAAGVQLAQALGVMA